MPGRPCRPEEGVWEANAMTLPLADFPVCGRLCLVFEAQTPPAGEQGPAATAAPEPVAFGRLVALYQNNEHLLSQLSSLRLKLARARAYLLCPGSNTALAEAQIAFLKAKQTAALTLLRSNRIEARALLGAGDGRPPFSSSH
jgi:hypothetical protein